MTATGVVWVGIDAGKASHHAAAVDAAGKRLWSVKVANGQRQIEDLISRAAGSGAEVRWAVDLVSPAAALLLAILLSGGQKVVYVPGRVVHGMAQVFRGEGKTDAKDALVIADTARMRGDLAELAATDDLVVKLTRLVSYRADVMADWVRGVNRLRELLSCIFPALEASFDYSARSALILLTGYCTPAEVRAAGAEGLAAHLREHGAWAKGIDAMAAKAGRAAQQQTVVLPGEAATAMLVKRIARQLLDVDREIKDTGKLITSRFRDHPQARIIESLPGMGPILGAQFLVATDGGPWRRSPAPAAWPPTPASCPSPATPGASPATTTGPSASTGRCGRSSTSWRCPASAPKDHRRSSTSANGTRTSSIPRPCSPWPGAWSTSCGRCCAITGSTVLSRPRR